MGSAGDSPAPVGPSSVAGLLRRVDDPPTGTAENNLRESPSLLARTVAPIPSGESPDGTGGSPVLPKTIFQTRSKPPRRVVFPSSGRATGICHSGFSGGRPRTVFAIV